MRETQSFGDPLPAHRPLGASKSARPQNRCKLRRFSSPYEFHRRYGYANATTESPAARSIAMAILGDASEEWSGFLAEISGEPDREKLHASVRRILSRLGRLEATFGEAAAGATFETYSQARSAFVAARMQLDEIMDGIYDGRDPVPVAPTGAVDRATGSVLAHTSPSSEESRRRHPGIDVTIPSNTPNDTPGLPAMPSRHGAQLQPEGPHSHPSAEGAAYRLGMLIGTIAGAAVIFHSLAR